MTLHNFDDGERFAALSLDKLAEIGVSLTAGSNFEDYRMLLKEARPDHILGDPFEPRLHDLNPTNAFWMIGRNSAGHIIHTQAMRMIETGGVSLGEYLRFNFRDFPPSGVDIDLERSRFRAGPGVSRVFGTACYHGEYWIGGEPGEFRGTGLSSLLGRYAFWEAMNRWDPDNVFAFMQKEVVCKGFAARHAYLHMQPGALRWFLTGVDTPIEGYLTYMDRADMRFVLEMPAAEEKLRAQAA